MLYKITHKPHPIPFNIPYAKINYVNVFAKLANIIPVIEIVPPIAIILFEI
jgi:hypothetical protein